MTLSKYIIPTCIAGAAFFAMAASSPQCARTQDATTSPAVGTLGDGNPCIEDCIGGFQESMKSEQARFKAAIQACDGDEACQEQEEAVHEAMIGEIQADKSACFENCGHEQGDGSGGQ
jgi:hypothetical protein